MAFIIFWVVIMLALIAISKLSPDIDCTEDGDVLLWYSPLLKKNERRYVVLWRG